MAFGKLKVRGRNEHTLEVLSTGGDSVLRVDTLNGSTGEPAVTCTSDISVAGASITVTGEGEVVTTPGLVVGAGGITAGTDAGVTLADSLILRGFASDGTTPKVFTIKCVGGVVTVCSITDPA